MTLVDDRLARVRYRVDSEPHIRVDAAVCAHCQHQVCVNVCPAGCFSLEGKELRFAHDGCLECGSCRIVCDRKAVRWGYPKGGYGVTFRFS
ncbi:MAG: ferredoxin family protein [Chloroflexota bacterium]